MHRIILIIKTMNIKLSRHIPEYAKSMLVCIKMSLECKQK